MSYGMTLGVVIFALVLIIYFIPSMIAQERKQKNLAGIIVLNIFLGWTFIGWVVALIWALKKE